MRFPIQRALHYRTLNRRAEIVEADGETLNISSTGILFTSDHQLPIGTRLEMRIEWPTEVNEKGFSRVMVVRGRVIREHAKGIFALRIKQYKFRIVPSKSMSQAG